MNLLIVTYKADISGGSNRAMLEVIDMLLKRQHKITLLVPKKQGGLYEEARKRGFDCFYVPYTRVGMVCPNDKIASALNQITMELKLLHDHILAWQIGRKLKNNHFDLIYSNGSATHFGRIISKVLHCPHVWHVREFFGDNQLLPINAYNRMKNRTDKFIVISNSMKDRYDSKLGNEKVIMISDGMACAPQLTKKVHKGFNILLAGRIAPAKNQLDAVMALEYLEKQFIDTDLVAKLFLAGGPVTSGDENYESLIKNYIKERGLEEKIVFLGEVKDMAELRTTMDVGLMCSECEPFGRVTLEGMRAGLPVIGTSSGGTLDIIKENVSGLFYSPGDVKELSSKLYTLQKNPKYLRELSASAQEYGQTHFTEVQLEKVVNLIEEMFEEIN